MAWPGRNSLVGLDIGTHTIKVAEIRTTKTGCILSSFGMTRRPPDGGATAMSPGYSGLESAIRDLLVQKLRLKGETELFGLRSTTKVMTVLRHRSGWMRDQVNSAPSDACLYNSSR